MGKSLLEALEKVPDPRSNHGLRHPLSAILALSVCAMTSGTRGLCAIAQWGRLQGPDILGTLGFTLWALRGYPDWPGHKQVMKVERWCRVKGKTTCQVRYAITSLGIQTSDDRLLQLVRGHWGIENCLHYVRDITMGEDGSQIRSASAPQAMAAVRNPVLAILRLSGATNVAAAIRDIAWRPIGALRLLGLLP